MSEKQFFSITGLSGEDGQIVAEVRIDPTNEIFKGHFPGAPVTPGVIQLQMVKKVAEQHLKKDLKVKAIRTCKFLEVLNPENTPVVIVELVIKESEGIEVAAMGKCGELTFFKAQITYI